MELPDDWLNLGDAWLMPKPQEAEEIHFGGRVRTRWDNGHLMVVHEDYTGCWPSPAICWWRATTPTM